MSAFNTAFHQCFLLNAELALSFNSPAAQKKGTQSKMNYNTVVSKLPN
jgi:dihydroneopterin aldolase